MKIMAIFWIVLQEGGIMFSEIVYIVYILDSLLKMRVESKFDRDLRRRFLHLIEMRIVKERSLC